jgi:membrane protein implicated in regulation of membrane protease activity
MWQGMEYWLDHSQFAPWIMGSILALALIASTVAIFRMIGSSPLLIGAVAASLAALAFGLTWASPVIGILAFIAAHLARSRRQHVNERVG